MPGTTSPCLHGQLEGSVEKADADKYGPLAVPIYGDGSSAATTERVRPQILRMYLLSRWQHCGSDEDS